MGNRVAVAIIDAGKGRREVIHIINRLPIINATQVDVRRLQGIEVPLSAIHIVGKPFEVDSIADNPKRLIVKGHG